MRVPQAGMNPEDRAVEPVGRASRSSSTQSTPALRSDSAATRPQAPAPTMATGTCGVPSGNKEEWIRAGGMGQRLRAGGSYFVQQGAA